MPLAEHALTTYEAVSATLQLSSDDAANATAQALIERYINACSEAIERIACRHFERTATAVTEYYPGYGGVHLVLDRAPIVSVGTIDLVTIDGTAQGTLDNWRVDNADAGIVYRPGRWPLTADVARTPTRDTIPGSERYSIRVQYTAGWITPYQADESTVSPYAGGALGTRNLPYDIEEACIESVVARWRRGTQGFNIQNQTLEGLSMSFSEPRKLLTSGAYSVAKSYWLGGRV